MCDGASDMVLLFEMVGAVSLRRDGAAHETLGEGQERRGYVGPSASLGQ